MGILDSIIDTVKSFGNNYAGNEDTKESRGKTRKERKAEKVEFAKELERIKEVQRKIHNQRNGDFIPNAKANEEKAARKAQTKGRMSLDSIEKILD